MDIRILFMMEQNLNSKRSIALIVKSYELTLKLTVKEKYFEDLKKEFKVKKLVEVAGKKALLEPETGFIYRKRNSPIKYQKMIPVPCEISIPKLQTKFSQNP